MCNVIRRVPRGVLGAMRTAAGAGCFSRYDVAAHGVSNEHQLVTEHVDGGAYIVDIVGDGT